MKEDYYLRVSILALSTVWFLQAIRREAFSFALVFLATFRSQIFI